MVEGPPADDHILSLSKTTDIVTIAKRCEHMHLAFKGNGR